MLAENGIFIVHYIEKSIFNLVGGKWGAYKLAAFCFTISLLFSFPDLDILSTNIHSKTSYFGKIDSLIKNPFQPIGHDVSSLSGSHEAKMNFRLFLPVVCKLFNINIFLLWSIHFFAGIVFYLVVYKSLLKYVNDEIACSFITLSLALSYPGKAFTNDIYGNFDGFPFLFVALAFYSSFGWLKSLLLVSAFLCDERSLVAGLGVAFFHVHLENTKSFWRKFLLASIPFVFFVAVRFFISTKIGTALDISLIGFGTLKTNYTLLPLAILTSLDGLWIIFPLFFVTKFIQKDKLSILLLPSIIVFILMCCMVFDVSRSVSYLYIFGVIMFCSLCHSEPPISMRNISWIVCMVSFVLPNYLLQGTSPFWLSPIFPKLLKYI